MSWLYPGHDLPDLQSQSPAHGRRHSVADLTVFVQSGAVELEGVRKSLAAGTLSYRHQPG